MAVAAVAFAIMIGASTYWHHRSQTAAENLYAAERLPAFSDEQIKKFEELVSDYSRTPAGQEAMMKLGNIYLEKKEYDKASDQFKKLAGRSRNHPILKIAAMHMMAATELTQGNAKEAAETYLKAAADPGNILSSNSRYHAALSFEKAGDLDRAAVLYKQIIEDTGKEENKGVDLKIRDTSEERLIWLIADKKVQG